MNFDKRLKSDGYDKDWYIDFHELVQNEAMKWSRSSKYLTVYVFSERVWTQ